MAKKAIFDEDKSKDNRGFDDSGSGKKGALRERELSVAVNPKKVLKGLFVVVLLLGVFFLGRLSANNFDLTGLATSDEVAEAVEEAPAEEEVVEETPEVEEVVEEETPPVEEELSEPESAEDEKIVTSYGKVSVVINKPEIKWMDTWGKITALSYTIENNEEGTVLPGSFKMTVEGYTDESSQKRVNFPESQQRVKAGEKVSAKVDIKDGFSYAKQTAGNLVNVRLSVILYDNSGKPMASFSDEFDLSG